MNTDGLKIEELHALAKSYGRAVDENGQLLFNYNVSARLSVKKRRFRMEDTAGNLLCSMPVDKQVECLKMMLEKYWFAKKLI